MMRIATLLFTVSFCLCGLTAYSKSDHNEHGKTKEEWKAEYFLPEYEPNRQIFGQYDTSLAAKCVNGVFVGRKENGVSVWRGIPYAKQPTGERRFKRPEPEEPSDNLFEAYHYMKSGMQRIDPDEIASMYEQGEDCLGLNIWTSTEGEKNKPVFVFIHGGGWMAGGTSDPLYNGYHFAKNNPDILVVTVDYRLGMLGQINLSSFPDGKDYPESEALCILDLIQSLKWIKENISAFGGDPNNVTICGESAGAGAVSMLCLMTEAKGLFSKAIAMSGSVAQFSEQSETTELVAALKEEFDCETVADLQKIPFDELKKWWSVNVEDIYHHPVRGNSLIESDPLEAWKPGDSSDLIVLQGDTVDEFQYYRRVFANIDEMFDIICEGMAVYIRENSSPQYGLEYDSYIASLNELGYSDKRVFWEFLDDHAFNAGNIYQAEMHAKNGGKGFFYTFETEYDGDYAYLGAAHAVDCYYLFGTFDGDWVFGTEEEVDLSVRFQKMIANFCKTGDPSTDGLSWQEYDEQNRYQMMIGKNMRLEKNPEKNRIDAIMKMMELSDLFRFTGNEGTMIEHAEKINPETVEKCRKVWNDLQQ